MMKRSLAPSEVDFWLDVDKYSNYLEERLNPNNQELIFNIDMVRLSSIRKSISNFVRILAKKNIPVYFNDRESNININDKIIYISAKINTKQDFDVAVGLALHEAAHSVKTDFDIVKMAWTNIPHEILVLSDSKNIRRPSIEKFIKTTWNVIEDRFIDDYIFNSAPGYRGYYVALYDRFWNSPDIDEYLLSDLFRYPSLDSYMFRITNFTNENTDLLALPRLDEIADVIDIENINRLKNTKDRIKTAFKVVEIVLNCLDVSNSPNNEVKKCNSLVRPEDFFDFGDKLEEGEKENKSAVDVGSKMVDEISDVISGEDTSPENLKENKDIVKKIHDMGVSSGEEKKLNNILDSQRKFLKGEITKETVSPEQKQTLDLIEKHGIELVKVESPVILSGDERNLKVDCIVVRRMTKELIFSGQEMFPLSGVMSLGKETPDPPKDVADAVKKGILLGTKLGRQLQIRNELNLVKTIRKKSGKINRRHLHEAAFDSEDLFYKVITNQYRNASLHITVDASGSMSRGNKWIQTMVAVVAICKATSMVDNVHVTVSFRSTQVSKSLCLPYVIMAYDSKVDKFSKVKNLFTYLTPQGFTPEGLAFGAIMNLFENITPDEEDRYFLNLSDGEPCYRLNVPKTGLEIIYQDEVGVNHTKAQIDKIKKYGVEILSYFIEEEYNNKISQKSLDDSPLRRNFKKMYGKTAKFIDVENVSDLAMTINKLFLIKRNEKKT